MAFPNKTVPNAPNIRGFRVYVPVGEDILVGQIRLFAHRDSPAALSCDVAGRPPLEASDSPEAFRLCNDWISACLDRHEACRQTCSGDAIDESSAPVLPTRVIHVGCPEQGIRPHLIETLGKRAHYVALSHCWGTHKPPIMTTLQTSKAHLTGIQWNELPRVYQDAFVATRRLGFEYIWVDSLCILQDSAVDWLAESRRMGSVYQNARLTIAASHASDSSQPCFFPRPPDPPAVELPYISRSGEHQGSIYATQMPLEYTPITPESSPLDQRAWATQEWLLSRRMVFFTEQCLVWSCKTISQRETGGSFHSTARNTRWKAIVEKYSARSLTKASDRLIALEGLRLELGKKRGTDIYCLGLWKHDMPEQLLWYCKQPAERARSPLGLPSWTWASTIHGVRFVVAKKAKNACKGVKYDDTNQVLVVRGVQRKITISPYEPNRLRSLNPEISEYLVLADMLEQEIPPDMACAICVNNTPLGKGVLDEGLSATPTTAVAVLLMTGKLVTSPNEGRKSVFHQQWVLLLRQSAQLTEVYERVGAGLIITAQPLFAECPVTQLFVG
ncbi:HET-domain-containing protein [Sporormia fimetaria CBS 119925]|uniref:HET-domain-containing protein n=1 Tax=Sporormia fimetaria CBS 119925 TaxID=1340428 RepID=A0A6A6VLV2_9PLEO|nr:HET-domain-containing protein [Sporormia fimetaria CBS 119925]